MADTGKQLFECGRVFHELRQMLDARRVMYMATAATLYAKLRDVDDIRTVTVGDMDSLYKYVTKLIRVQTETPGREVTASDAEKQFATAFREYAIFTAAIRDIDEVDPHTYERVAGDGDAGAGEDASGGSGTAAEAQQHAAATSPSKSG